MLTHINNKLSCPKKSSDKKFKGTGDLNHHIKTHTKGSWYCCDKCDYKNKDKCNTDSHMRTHNKEDEGRYECDKCGKKCISAPSSKGIVNRDVKCKAIHCILFLFYTPSLEVYLETLHVGTTLCILFALLVMVFNR